MKVMGPGTFVTLSRPPERKGELIVRDASETQAQGAQIAVDNDEVAAVVRDAKVVGVIAPGRHLLEVAQLPFLQAVADGGQFRSTLAFVTLTPIRGCRFGGPVGLVQDQTGARANVMLFGEYTFRVLDPVRFINDMVGTKGDGERVQKWLADKLMERLRSCLVEWMTGGYFSIATAPGAGPGLAQAVAARAGDFAEYGLELVSIDSVTVQPR